MEKRIVHLSDTSHPFTEKGRTLTKQEVAAISAFLRNGQFYGDWWSMRDDLHSMLSNTETSTTTLIDDFMNKYGVDGTFRSSLENLFILRAMIEAPIWERSWHNDPNHNNADAIAPFSASEVEGLGFDSSEIERINMQTARNEFFRGEADKRVIRYFIGQSGWVWFVHFIVDMPEQYDGKIPNTVYRAKDGMSTLHMTSLFMSEEKAWDSINEDIRFNTQYNDDILTHVVELDKM